MVDKMCHMVCVLFLAYPKFSFLESSVDKAILGVHNSGLWVAFQLCLYLPGSGVTCTDDIIGLWQGAYEIQGLTVALQYLQCEKARCITLYDRAVTS